MTAKIRPAAGEYLDYYDRYISLVPQGDVLVTLRDQIEQTVSYVSKLSEEQGAFRYAPGKWSVKECVGHMIDTERIFAYRALRVSRNDKTPIEGFEQDDYVKNGSFDSCALADLLAEFQTVRESTELFFEHLADEAWGRRGVANKSDITVRAIAYIVFRSCG